MALSIVMSQIPYLTLIATIYIKTNMTPLVIIIYIVVIRTFYLPKVHYVIRFAMPFYGLLLFFCILEPNLL